MKSLVNVSIFHVITLYLLMQLHRPICHYITHAYSLSHTHKHTWTSAIVTEMLLGWTVRSTHWSTREANRWGSSALSQWSRREQLQPNKNKLKTCLTDSNECLYKYLTSYLFKTNLRNNVLCKTSYSKMKKESYRFNWWIMCYIIEDSSSSFFKHQYISITSITVLWA